MRKIFSDSGDDRPTRFDPWLVTWLVRVDWAFVRQIVLCCALMGAVNVVLMAYVTATKDRDFVSFYTAAKEVAAGTPAATYDASAHHIAEAAATGCCSGEGWYAFFYPPIMLLLVWPLAALTYIPAIVAWGMAQLLMYMAALRVAVGRGVNLLPYVFFPSAVISLNMGQNSVLTAAIFTAGTAALGRGRPFLAGLVLGCLACKPHFGLILPVALIAGREWRAVAGAAVAVVGLVAVSALAFGWQTWATYLHMFDTSVIKTFAEGQLPFAFLVSPYGAARLLGADNNVAQVVQLCSTLAVAVLVGMVWWKTTEIAPRAAILIAGTMLSVPVILFYDLMLASVAMAWLVVDTRRIGWLPMERFILTMVAVLALFERSMSEASGIPYGPLVAIIMMALAWHHAFFGKSAMASGVDGNKAGEIRIC